LEPSRNEKVHGVRADESFDLQGEAYAKEQKPQR